MMDIEVVPRFVSLSTFRTWELLFLVHLVQKGCEPNAALVVL